MGRAGYKAALEGDTLRDVKTEWGGTVGSSEKQCEGKHRVKKRSGK